MSLETLAELVPLTLDGPDFSRAHEVTTEDISRGGASILSPTPPLGPHWALVMTTGGTRVIMEVAIRDLRRISDGRFRIACQFVRRVPLAA